jgi:hypothetical protein
MLEIDLLEKAKENIIQEIEELKEQQQNEKISTHHVMSALEVPHWLRRRLRELEA